MSTLIFKNNTFLAALRAFWMREFRLRFGSFRLGYAWAIIEPLYQVVLFTVLHAVIRGPDHDLYGASPAVFMLYGVITWLAFQHGIDRSLGGISSNKGLFGYRQIKPIDIVLVRVGIEFLIMSIAYFLLLFIALWLGHAPQVPNFLLIGFYAICLMVFTFGLGLILEVGSALSPNVQRLSAVLMRPLFFISGLFFAIDMVPEMYWPYLLWNPILHASDLIRDSAISGYTSPASGLYLVSSALIALFLGLALYRRYQNRLY